MTAAALGYGTKLLMHSGEVGDAKTALASYVEIGEIREGPDQDESINEVDVTNHQSPGRRREYIAGLIDGATVSITCNYLPEDPSQDRTDGLLAVYNAGETRTFRLIEPGNTSELQFDAIITSKAITRPVDDAMQVSFDLRQTGDETEESPLT